MPLCLSSKKMCKCTGRLAINFVGNLIFDYYCFRCGQYYTVDEYKKLPDYKE